MDNHQKSRKRLRPWLERMIESNKCPGLVWENREDRTFRIPWRHFNNKDWAEKDSQIFMEWAKYTEKYHDGDKLEYPVWKTRLRCALKKIPEIKELPDRHHLEDPDPYRVYQFVDIPLMKKLSDVDSDFSVSPGSTTSFFMNSPAVIDYLEESLTPPQKYYNDTFLSPKQPSNVPTVVYEENSFKYNNLTAKNKSGYTHQFGNSTRETQNCHLKLDEEQFPTNYHYDQLNIASESHFLQMPSTSHNYSGLNNMTSSQLELQTSTLAVEIQPGNDMKSNLPSDLMSLESCDLCPDCGITDDTDVCLSDPQGATCSLNAHVMQLNLKYGFPSNVVLQKKVSADGCRLYFGAPPMQNTFIEEALFGPKTVTQIEMPDIKSFPEISDEQKTFIYELLDSMERGLVLTYKDGDIYAQRLCRTRVFVSDGSTESRLLSRKEKMPTKVFDFSEFKASLENFHATKNAAIPKHYFFLTFGQELKKNRSDPMGRVLIHVQVIHSEAEEYTKISFSDASHSFPSDDPQMSTFDTYDQLLQRFKHMNVKK